MKTTLLCLVSLSGILYAQSIELDALDITSTPLQDTELTAADAVEVYTADDIEAAHVRSVYDFINRRTSLFSMPSFGNPMAQKIDLHGYGIENGYQNIVITLNGRRLNNIDMVPQLLSAIAPADIERLEIIKSGGIVLGGDGANAGVINIVTKNDATKSLTLYGGLYHTYGGAFRLGHSDESLSVSASGEAHRTAGTRHIDAEQNRDSQRITNGNFRLSVTPNDDLELHAGAALSRNDVHYGGPMTQEEYDQNPAQPGSGYGFGPAPSHQRYDTEAYDAGIRYDLNAHWTARLDTFIEKKTSNYLTYDSIFHYDYQSLKAAADYVHDSITVTFGSDYFDGTRAAEPTDFSLANETTKRNLAGFALAQYLWGKHTLKAGYRFTRVDYTYNDTANDLSRSDVLHGIEAGYNYRIGETQSVFINYARGFQAPDIDRFFNKDFNGNVTFNGFIEPMMSDGVTAGYTALSPANKFKLSLFYTALRNEIYYYADPAYLASANTNIDRSHKYGLDVSDTLQATAKVALTLSYNYVQAVIDEEVQNGEDFSGNSLPGVSNHMFKAALNLQPTQSGALTLTHIYRSQAYAMNDIGNDFAQKQQPYNSTDVTWAYTQPGYALFATINNLFNVKNGLWVEDDAIYPVHFTTTAYAGVTLKF